MIRPSSGVLIDIAVAFAVIAGTLAQLSHGGIGASRTESAELSLVGLGLAVLSTVPVIAWRHFPFGVFVVTATASVLLAIVGHSIDLMLGPSVALYLLASSRERDTPWTQRTTAVVVGLLVAYLGATSTVQGTVPGLEFLHTGLAWAVAWFAGERTRLGREQIAEYRERALYAERAAESERLLAAAEERARIARDLHDSAGHAINVIAVRAGAARLRHHKDPDRSLLALATIEEVARQTAEEIDQIVCSLRKGGSENGGVEAPPGLASLDSLIEHHSAAGLDVRNDTTAWPRRRSGRLPDPPRSAHRRRTSWRWQRPGSNSVWQSVGRTQRYQPATLARSVAVGRRAWFGRHA